MPETTVTVDVAKRRLPFRLVSNVGDWDVDMDRAALAGLITIKIPLGDDGALAGDPTVVDANGAPIEATFTRRQADAQ